MMPLVYAGAGVALALLLWVQLRMARRIEEARESFERLEKAQRDGALDVRQRLEEAAREAERFEVRWKEAQERLDAAEERVGAVGPVIEEARLARTAAEDGLRAVETRIGALEEASRLAGERLEATLREHREAADGRAREEAQKVSALAVRVQDVEALHARLVASIPGPASGAGKREPAPPSAPVAKAAPPAPAAVAPTPPPAGAAPARPTPAAATSPANAVAESAPVRPARTPASAEATAAPRHGAARAFLVVVFVLAAALVLVSWLA